MAISTPQNAHPTSITTYLYDATSCEAVDGLASGAPGQFRWIDVCGLKDDVRIADLATDLGLSGLSVAELFHLDQRAQTDVDGDLVLTVLRMPVSSQPFVADQISLVLGPDFVLTLREQPRDCLDAVRKRLAGGKGRIRSSSGYLFYAICDAIIDSYFPVLEAQGDLIEAMEERILRDPEDGAMRDTHQIKRDLSILRHAIWPMREALAALQRDDMPQISDPLLPYLRDCSDHAFQLLDMVEVFRETAQGLVELQLSSLSNRMNAHMKVLTMIATIFIPMTFIAGVYGMNFDRASPYNLPELGWRFGYLFALALMAAAAATMLFFFWRLGWIFGRSEEDRRRGGSGTDPSRH